MKVALYQEGENWDGPDIIRVFTSMEVALNALPKGSTINILPPECTRPDYISAVNKSRTRWITIKTREVEETA